MQPQPSDSFLSEPFRRLLLVLTLILALALAVSLTRADSLEASARPSETAEPNPEKPKPEKSKPEKSKPEKSKLENPGT